MENHSAENINEEVKKSIDEQSIVFSDQSTSYVNITDFVELHITEKSDKQTTTEKFSALSGMFRYKKFNLWLAAS